MTGKRKAGSRYNLMPWDSERGNGEQRQLTKPSRPTHTRVKEERKIATTWESSVLKRQPDFCKSKKVKETFGEMDEDRGGFADEWVLSSRGHRKGFINWTKVVRDVDLPFCLESSVVIRKWESTDLTTGPVRSPRQLSSSVDMFSLLPFTHFSLHWTSPPGIQLQSTCIPFSTVLSVFWLVAFMSSHLGIASFLLRSFLPVPCLSQSSNLWRCHFCLVHSHCLDPWFS